MIAYKKSRRNRPAEHVRRVKTRKGLKIVKVNPGIKKDKVKKAKRVIRDTKSKIVPLGERKGWRVIPEDERSDDPFELLEKAAEDAKNVDLKELASKNKILRDEERFERDSSDLETSPEFSRSLSRLGWTPEKKQRIRKNVEDLKKARLREETLDNILRYNSPVQKSKIERQESKASIISDELVDDFVKESGLSKEEARKVLEKVQKDNL